MCCSTFEGGEGLAPGSLQGLVCQQLIMSLQAPGEDHLGAMLLRELQGQGRLCVHLIAQVERMHLVSSRLHSAGESHDLQVLVVAF